MAVFLQTVSGGSRVIMLLVVNVMFVLSGMFLEPLSAIYLLVPLFLPAVKSVGVDPIHFGAIMTVNLSMAHLTPPVGLALYLAAQLADVPFAKAAKAAMPFIICEIVVILLVTFNPWIALTLASLMD